MRGEYFGVFSGQNNQNQESFAQFQGKNHNFVNDFTYFPKRGEIFGLRSFITSEKRELSAMSRNFSTVLEIKKSDFLEVLQRSKRDYVKKPKNREFSLKNP